MKSKLGIVLKTNFINTYKLKQLTKKKAILYLFLFLYIGISLFMVLHEFLGKVYHTLTLVQLTSYYLTILFSIASIFSFFFTIFSAKNSLFENKDNDLLFSLPIDKKTVLFSRLSIILLYNFFIGLFMIIPGLAVYFGEESFQIYPTIIIVLLTLFSSVIPTILASIFGYFIAFITSQFQHKNRIELLSYILFIGIYMLVIYQGDSFLELFSNHPDTFMNLLKTVFFPIYLINLSITKSNFLYIVFYIILNLGLLYLFLVLLNKKYYQIIRKLKTEKTTSNFKMRTLTSSRPMIALTKKEVKRYFSSAIYLFNTSFGMLLLLLASGASFFYQEEELLAMIGENSQINSNVLVLYILLFAICFSTTTNSSISIERNNFWILKMLPLKTKQIFRAKKYVNLILILPITFISLILFLISGYINGLELFEFLGISLVLSITIANFGLLCNLLFPKLDAPNDTAIVKQSASAMMGIMVPMVFVVVYIVALDSLTISSSLILGITFLLFLFLSCITNFLLNTWGVKKYRELSS